jgi:predicted phage terminase large subunit-like protein
VDKPKALPEDVRIIQQIEELGQRAKIGEERERLENNFSQFLAEAWHSIDGAAYQRTWSVDAVADHLEAVTLGSIKRLLINIPPRCAKTNTASIAWNGWIWAQRELSFVSGPQVKFLSGSYNEKLSLMASTATRRLLLSPWYQARWSDRFVLRADQNAKYKFDNTSGGSRISTSVGGSLLGLGGDVIVIDDPHNAETEKVVETDADRRKVASWWQEISTTRRNSPEHTAIVVVMQRLHQGDLSGLICKEIEADRGDWVHLMLPMLFEDRRQYWTVKLPQYVGDEPWADPRATIAEETKQYGQLMWPERFSQKDVDEYRATLGPFMFSGRFQQLPVPKGGGIIKADWWQLWSNEEAKRYGLEWTPTRMEFPRTDMVVASLDTAMGEKNENDYTALTVWGVWKDKYGNRRAMLMFAWQKRLPLNGRVLAKYKAETQVAYEARQKQEWGLVEWIADTCKRYKVKRLLIENKTKGHDVANELKRLYARENFGIWMVNPAGDKVSRTHSVVSLFTTNSVWAPFTDWSELVIDNVAVFPKGEHDDLHDTVTQFLNHARETELLVLPDERQHFEDEEAAYRGQDQTVAEQYGV